MRKKLHLSLHRGEGSDVSWDMSSSKTPSLGRHFRRRKGMLYLHLWKVTHKGRQLTFYKLSKNNKLRNMRGLLVI
jgi:hypothetical protein